MKVLSKKEYSGIIAWTPSGRSFNILSSKRFVAEIMPEYFKTSKYSSFTRKLHRWGFVRHYRGEDVGAYHHKYFQKGEFELAEKMSCYKQEPPKPSTSLSVSKSTAPEPASLSPHFAPLGGRAAGARLPSASAMPALTHSSSAVQRPAALDSHGLSANALSAQIQSLSMISHSATAPATDLNVAIELEVARRVRESIDAAVLRRQALDMIQQREQQLKVTSLLRGRHLPWAQAGIERLKRLALTDAHRELGGAAKPDPTAMLANAPLTSLPPTNIQGAKTA